jgi:hypothetical protein
MIGVAVGSSSMLYSLVINVLTDLALSIMVFGRERLWFGGRGKKPGTGKTTEQKTWESVLEAQWNVREREFSIGEVFFISRVRYCKYVHEFFLFLLSFSQNNDKCTS